MVISFQLVWALLPLVGFPCPYGFARSCGLGAVGACREGVQVCMVDRWGPCLCGQAPRQEICDCKDNDCDGVIDESCSCGCPGTTRSCGFSTKGQCQMGTQTCIGLGHWGLCKGTVGPGRERCDQTDNDCDGLIDEGGVCDPCRDGDVQPCFSLGSALIGEGPCKAGTQTCSGGKWGACVGQILPQPEVCDNIDNDCNGLVDGMMRLCGQDKGACQGGVQTCELGKWSSCRGEVTPTPEVCDCKDNDCDGTVDEDVACPDGQICYYGRCIPNCHKGECIYPSEVTAEPATEIALDATETTPDEVPSEPAREALFDEAHKPSSDGGAPDVATEPSAADAADASLDARRDVASDEVMAREKEAFGERGDRADGAPASVAGHCGCGPSHQTTGGLCWLVLWLWLVLFGARKRGPTLS